MHRLWLSAGMLIVGVTLAATAQVAAAGPEKRGGIFRVGARGAASVQIDPQLAYTTTGWWLEYATAAKLYNYPDKRGPAGSRLVPEVASSFTASREGRRYTFLIRDGFRFSDGTPVTAANFEYAIDRAANHDLASPGAQFIMNIVGAREVSDGDATHVRGVRVSGNRLIIDLMQPDPTFMAKITLPFFQATSTKLPLDREIVDVDSIDDIPSAGPYAFSRNDVSTLISIRQNPYWTRGPGRQRPRNLAGLDIHWWEIEAFVFQEVLRNRFDLGPVPAADVENIARLYGVNKTRFWVQLQSCTGYLPMNLSNDLFKGNVKLRRAINFAINRRAYIAQAGTFAGKPWTRILNPGVPGWSNEQPYPRDPRLAHARKLAAGSLRDGKITVYYRSSGTINPAQAQIVRQDLINLGFEPANITMKGFSGGNIYTAMGIRGNDADIGVSMGWCSEFPDPATILESAFTYTHGVPPLWRRKFDAASKLVGPERLEAFGRLDLAIMRKFAPVAVERTYNNRYFFSDRVDPKSLVYINVYSDWSIPALALK